MLGLRSFIYLGLAAVFAFLLWFAYDYGKKSEREKVPAAVEALREREASLLDQVEEAKKKTKVIYRERSSVVQKAVGPCIDERLPAPLLDSLQRDVPAG